MKERIGFMLGVTLVVLAGWLAGTACGQSVEDKAAGIAAEATAIAEERAELREEASRAITDEQRQEVADKEAALDDREDELDEQFAEVSALLEAEATEQAELCLAEGDTAPLDEAAMASFFIKNSPEHEGHYELAGSVRVFIAQSGLEQLGVEFEDSRQSGLYSAMLDKVDEYIANPAEFQRNLDVRFDWEYRSSYVDDEGNTVGRFRSALDLDVPDFNWTNEEGTLSMTPAGFVHAYWNGGVAAEVTITDDCTFVADDYAGGHGRSDYPYLRPSR